MKILTSHTQLDVLLGRPVREELLKAFELAFDKGDEETKIGVIKALKQVAEVAKSNTRLLPVGVVRLLEKGLQEESIDVNFAALDALTMLE